MANEIITYNEMPHAVPLMSVQLETAYMAIETLTRKSPAIASKQYINLVPEEMAGDVEF